MTFCGQNSVSPSILNRFFSFFLLVSSGIKFAKMSHSSFSKFSLGIKKRKQILNSWFRNNEFINQFFRISLKGEKIKNKYRVNNSNLKKKTNVSLLPYILHHLCLLHNWTKDILSLFQVRQTKLAIVISNSKLKDAMILTNHTLN